MNLKWTKLMGMAILSFLAMYALMYMMVDIYGNVYANLNQLYMAAVMTGGMMLIEVVIMKSMYGKKVIIATVILSIVTLVLSFTFLRSQVGISDKEFIKSMIGHHGAALLMCENVELKDPEVQKLCDDIISGQQSQIDWMRAKLDTLK